MTLAERLRAALATGEPASRYADLDDLEGTAERPIPAAVLAAVVDRPEPGLLLTRRTATLRAHAGEIAFPGGRVDPGDADTTAAALREAQEEIGLDPAAVQVVGTLPAYRTGTGFSVTPVVGVVPAGLAFIPHAPEVDEVFEMPLAFALSPTKRVERQAMWRGRERRYLEIIWGPHRIWGATAAMIANLGERLGHG